MLTHGDFQPKNIHLDRSRLVVIDFDRAAWAPAGRDLGHFIGQTPLASDLKRVILVVVFVSLIPLMIGAFKQWRRTRTTKQA